MRDPEKLGGLAMEGVLDEACRGLPSDFRQRMGPDPGAGAEARSHFDASLLEAGLLQPGLLRAGLRELDQALNLDPFDREGAFSLLAADALLTLACETAALEDDGDEELYQIMRRISGRLT